MGAGVDGVNLHTLPGAAYQLFQFSHRDGRWRGAVAPVYYGLQLFAQAAPVGSRLLGVRGAPHSTRLSVWATRASDHAARLVLIDKDPGHPETVEVPARRAPTVGVGGADARPERSGDRARHPRGPRLRA